MTHLLHVRIHNHKHFWSIKNTMHIYSSGITIATFTVELPRLEFVCTFEGGLNLTPNSWTVNIQRDWRASPDLFTLRFMLLVELLLFVILLPPFILLSLKRHLGWAKAAVKSISLLLAKVQIPQKYSKLRSWTTTLNILCLTCVDISRENRFKEKAINVSSMSFPAQVWLLKFPIFFW